MTKEDHSCSHESLSYRVHNHPYTSKYRYKYIIHNATTQSKKVNQTLPTFQWYGPVRYRKCKTDIAIPREHDPSKEQENQKGTRRGGTLIHALEKSLRERREEKTALEGARPPNLLNIAIYGLAFSCLHLCHFCSHLRGRPLAISVHAPRVYVQKQKKHLSKQAKKKTKEIGKACKEHTNKESQTGANKAC